MSDEQHDYVTVIAFRTHSVPIASLVSAISRLVGAFSTFRRGAPFVWVVETQDVRNPETRSNVVIEELTGEEAFTDLLADDYEGSGNVTLLGADVDLDKPSGAITSAEVPKRG
jgi:hypothetical protein